VKRLLVVSLALVLAGLMLSACAKNVSSSLGHGVVSQWTAQATLKSGESLGTISCANVHFCVAMNGTSVEQTIDGGKVWTTEPVAKSYEVSIVSCASDYVCYAIGSLEGNYFSFLSETPTSAWIPASHALGEIGMTGASAISCPSDNECVAVGTDTIGGNADKYPVWVSNDLGAKGNPARLAWKESSIHFPNYQIVAGLTGVSCPTKEVCYAVAYQSAFGVSLFKSTSGATSWSHVSITKGTKVTTKDLEAARFNAISCPTTTSCTIVGLNQVGRLVIVQTKSGGVSWRWTVESNVREPVLDSWSPSVSCPAVQMCVVTDNHTILRTTDGGVTWVRESEPRDAGLLRSVSCPSSLVCFATAVRARVRNGLVSSYGAGHILSFKPGRA
jgi:hypothetical protein